MDKQRVAGMAMRSYFSGGDYYVDGDFVVSVVQSRKGTAAAVPFQQTVVLQSQLLG